MSATIRTARWPSAAPAPLWGLVVGFLVMLLPRGMQSGAAVGLVAVFGISHGASDHLMACGTWRRKLGRRWLVAFMAAYLTIAAAVFLLWQWLPQTVMFIFLAVSAWHFSQDARGDSTASSPGSYGLGWATAAYGLLPVAGSALLHQSELASLLSSLLASPQSAALFAQALRVLAVVAVAAALCAAFRFVSSSAHDAAIELTAVLAITVLLPPLIGFAAYFCFVHAPLQLRQRCTALRCGWVSYHKRVMPFTLGGIAVIGFAYFSVTTATSALIMGLAALTFPHMLLLAPFTNGKAGQSPP